MFPDPDRCPATKASSVSADWQIWRHHTRRLCGGTVWWSPLYRACIGPVSGLYRACIGPVSGLYRTCIGPVSG